MKRILLHYKNRIIRVAIFVTILEALMWYIFNFQSTFPLIDFLGNLYGCSLIFIIILLPFLFTRRAAKESLLSKEFSGWKLGICINLLFITLSFPYTILDYIFKLFFVKALPNNFNWTIYFIGSGFGILIVLFVGLCAGWLAQIIFSKKE